MFVSQHKTNICSMWHWCEIYLLSDWCFLVFLEQWRRQIDDATSELLVAKYNSKRRVLLCPTIHGDGVGVSPLLSSHSPSIYMHIFGCLSDGFPITSVVMVIAGYRHLSPSVVVLADTRSPCHAHSVYRCSVPASPQLITRDVFYSARYKVPFVQKW